MRGDKKHQFLTALVVFAVAIAGVYIYHMQDDYLSQSEIFALVENDTAALEQIASSDDPEQMERPDGVKKISVVDGTVEFSCGGSGSGEDTVYFGFYYSPNGTPDAVCCGARFTAAADLQPGGEGFGVVNGERYYYTQQITDCFYYYEAHF